MHLYSIDWRRLGPLMVLALATASACNLPRDADGTLKRVAGGPMRVGVVVHPPWVTDANGQIGGVEAVLVQRIADNVGARSVEWVRAPESTLVESLKQRQLDVVVGGLTADLPWTTEIAFTRPFAERDGKQHVLAVSRGENAWLVRIEQVVQGQRAAIAADLDGAAP